jgi:putative ATP-binding cassette transporter
MKLLTFMTQETEVSKQRILLLAAVSGIANSLLLVIINEAASGLTEGVFEAHLFAQYVLTFILFIFAQRASQREAVAAVEWALQRVRVRIANKVRLCDLRAVESLGDISSYSSLTQGANTIAQSAMYLVTGIESLLVLVFAGLYLLWLSPLSFVVALVLIGFTILLLVRHYQKTFQELSEASRKEGIFFERFTAILKGFKQLKTNRRESDDMFLHIRQLLSLIHI